MKDSDWLIFLCLMSYALCKSLCFGLKDEMLFAVLAVINAAGIARRAAFLAHAHKTKFQ